MKVMCKVESKLMASSEPPRPQRVLAGAFSEGRTARSKAVRTAAESDRGAGQKNRLLLPRNAATASSSAGGNFTRPPLSIKACERRAGFDWQLPANLAYTAVAQQPHSWALACIEVVHMQRL